MYVRVCVGESPTVRTGIVSVRTKGEIMTRKFERQVDKGVAALDEYWQANASAVRFDWRDRLRYRREAFDVSDFYNCTLGTLFGNFTDGVSVISGIGHGWDDLPKRNQWARDHGFLAPTQNYSLVAVDRDYRTLRNEWLRRI